MEYDKSYSRFSRFYWLISTGLLKAGTDGTREKEALWKVAQCLSERRLAASKPGGTRRSQTRSFGRDVKKLTGPIKRMAAAPTAAKERQRE